MDCLTNVVGLSRTVCDCWDTGKPVDFNTSLSGLYLSDLVPLEWTNSAADCERGGVWDILETARTNAINTLLADLPVNFSLKLDERFAAFKGWMGSPKFNSSMSVLSAGDWAGLRIVPNQIKGGVITLIGFELALENVSGGTTVDVYIYSNRDLTTPIDSTTVTLTTAGAFYRADFAAPVVLKLNDQDQDGYTYNDPYLEFYLVYQMPIGARYVNNLIFESGAVCCGNKKGAKTSREYPFLQYVSDVYGIEATTPADLYPNPRKSDSQAHGLRLVAEYGCDTMSWICEGLSYDPNQVGAGVYKSYARMFSHCLSQKMAAEACSLILSTSNINSVTIWSGEKLMGMRNHFNKNYMESSQWLAANFPSDLSDCFMCKQTIFKTSLTI